MLEQNIITVAQNSEKTGIIPFKKNNVTSLSEAFKKGTVTDNTHIKPSGKVTLEITDEGIKYTYKADKIFVGDDSFEFTVYLADGSSYVESLGIQVVERSTEPENIVKYLEFYLDTNDQREFTKTFTTSFNLDLEIPTQTTFAVTDKAFKVHKRIATNDSIAEYNVISNAETNTIFQISTQIYHDTAISGASIKGIHEVKLKVKISKQYIGDEFLVLTFKNIVNRVYNTTIGSTEQLYIILHCRTSTTPYNENEIVVNQRPEIEPPVFIYPDLEYPQDAEQLPSFKSKVVSPGDVLQDVIQHKEYDNHNNKAIKIGTNVPHSAVNLGYFYNKIASLNDTVSVVETNTNTVVMQYVEDWVHKRNLPAKNEDLFPETIEYKGEEGTYLEGFWGILSRDYVIWDESTMIDIDPKNKIVYKSFVGLTAPRAPLIEKYDDGVYTGNLKLVHVLYEPMSFVASDNSLHPKYKGKRFRAFAKYEGYIKKRKVLYNGSAKYSGIIDKKDGLANLDPEQPREVVMFPDGDGILHKTDGEYFLEDTEFMITDKFKDDVPLYYKYKLKYKVYDGIGKDENGLYQSDNIKLVNKNGSNVQDNLKYKIDIIKTNIKNVYDAYIYTSFVPTPENPIYVMYDGLKPEQLTANLFNDTIINPLEVDIGIMEKISVIPMYTQGIDFNIKLKTGITNKACISITNPVIRADTRNKVCIEYIVMADNMESESISAEILNKKYSLYSERDCFRDDSYIISQKGVNGYLTAKDMFLKHCTEEQALQVNSNTVFKVKFNLQSLNTQYNKDKCVIYTDSTGGGFIYGLTYTDTGFQSSKIDEKSSDEEKRFNRTLDNDAIYLVDNRQIMKGYSVICKNITKITINAPRSQEPLKGWYPLVNFAYFNKSYERIDNSLKIVYSVPEFDMQVYGEHGKPYIDIKNERAKVIGENTIRIKNTPMYVKVNKNFTIQNIRCYKVIADGTEKELNVASFNYKYGIIDLENKITTNDAIYVNYSYEENYYTYKGYYPNQDEKEKMVDLNLNPSKYFTYEDTENQIHTRKNCYNLFNKTIHFFLRPTRIIDLNTGEVVTDNKFCIYHKINDQKAEGPFDLHIGRIFLRHFTSLKSTTLLDTRSRGGGLIEAMSDDLRRELEPESDYYMDISTLDGKPFQQNSVIIVRLDKKILYKNGGRFTEEEVKKAVEKWASYGTYPIIEYVSTDYEEDLPGNTIEINKQIDNMTDKRSQLWVDIIKR